MISLAGLWRFLGRLGHRVLQPPMGWVLRLLDNRRTRVVLTDRHGRVALARVWLSHQGWELPGGGLRRGEAPTVGGTRELAEEVGVGAADLGPPGLRTFGELPDPTGAFTAVLLTGIVRDPACLAVPPRHRWEIVEVAWWPVDALPEDCDPLVHQALALLGSGGS